MEILACFHYIYVCLADEIGEKGTYHTHVFVLFASPVRFTTIQNKFAVAHIDPAYGSAKENRDYILKEGKYAGTEKAETRVEGTFFEEGDLPDEKEEKYPILTRIRKMIEEGFSTLSIIDTFPSLSFRIKEIEELRQRVLSEKYKKEKRNVKTIYVFGKTGTGKTSGIYQDNLNEEICRITNYINSRAMFDAYNGQRILVFEEFRSQVPISEMLSYLDIYPLMLPARYYDRVACYEKVYITSNLSLIQQYEDVQRYEPDTWDAFLRRITYVRRYTAIGKYEEMDLEGGFIPI